MNVLRLTQLLCCLLLITASANASEAIDKLSKQLNEVKTDTAKILILSDLAWEYSANQYAVADSIADIEIGLARKYPDTRYAAISVNDKAIVAYKKGDIPAAITLNKEALTIRRSLGNAADVASSLSKLGSCYYQTSSYAQALECQLECLKIYESLKLNRNLAYTYNNIAEIYSRLKQYPKALEFSHRASDLNRGIHDQFGVAGALGNSALIYEEMGQIDSSIAVLQEARRLFITLGIKSEIAITTNNLGSIYKRRGDLTKAYNYYTEALNVAKELGDKTAIAMYSTNYASTLIALNQLPAAESALLQSNQLSESINDRKVLARGYFLLTQLYTKMSKDSLADSYLKKYDHLKDSIFSEGASKQIAEMQIKYETNKKEEEIKIKSLELNHRNILLIVMSIIFLLIIGILWLSYNRYKLRQQNLLATEKLAQQSIKARAVLEAEESERNRIGRDLHDGIGQVLSAAKMNLSAVQASIAAIDTTQQERLQNAIDLVDESVKEVRNISHNMMPNMLLKNGLVRAVREFVNKMTVSENLKINLEIVGLQERIDATIETVIYRVLQEIVNNIIKHANASQMTIQLIQDSTELSLMVEDNGIGYEVSKTMESDNGIGLKNIISRVEFLGGAVHFDSMINRGSTVTIEIPLKG